MGLGSSRNVTGSVWLPSAWHMASGNRQPTGTRTLWRAFRSFVHASRASWPKRDAFPARSS